MRITVSTLSTIFSLDVSPDLELENFKTFCQLESGLPDHEMLILHNNRVLVENRKSLTANGLRDGDVVFIQHIGGDRLGHSPSTIEFLPLDDSTTADAGPSRSYDPTHIRDLLLADPTQLRLLQENNPRLFTELISGDLDRFSSVLNLQIEERDRRNRQRLKLMSAHPIDLEAQRLIAEEIRQKNVEANMEAAMEHNPETFGSVVMLYINCKVNGVPVKAFVDSGAQTTIMSASCAERCAIMRLIDTRWAGVAKGVGIQKIIGRIHMVEVVIESDYLTTSLSILDQQPMDMLLGLDMLRRHQCCIDLKRNVLRIGTTGTETGFLPESEVPECARLTEDDISLLCPVETGSRWNL